MTLKEHQSKLRLAHEIPKTVNCLSVRGCVLPSVEEQPFLIFLLPYLATTLGCYLIGSIPNGFLVVKQLTGEDIRTHGSGSTGATNVRRVAGDKAAKAVMLLDILKALVPVLVARLWLFPNDAVWHLVFAIAIVIGHSRSIFLGFTGGKSAASSLGAVLGFNPVAGLLTALIAFLVTKVSRYVSLGSLTAAAVTPILFFLLGSPQEYVMFTVVTGLYVAFLHKANIQRLIKGTENKLS